MTHFELAVQISASKSKYYRELMRFKVLVFSRFYMKIEKALKLSCFRQILKSFEWGLLVLELVIFHRKVKLELSKTKNKIY
jgi:hypothetical protein